MAIVAFTMGLGAGGCDSTGPGHSAQFGTAAKTVTLGGTVVFRDNGSGFYGILADNGGQYEPLNLDARFRSDGEHISFTGSLDTTKLGEHHWGNPIELASVTEVR